MIKYKFKKKKKIFQIIIEYLFYNLLLVINETNRFYNDEFDNQTHEYL